MNLPRFEQPPIAPTDRTYRPRFVARHRGTISVPKGGDRKPKAVVRGGLPVLL